MSPTLALLFMAFSVIAGIGLGVFVGYKIGSKVTDSSGKYWGANIGAILMGLILFVLSGFFAGQIASFFVIGCLGGAITGLKYGYGKSEGVWKTYDTFMKNDENMQSFHKKKTSDAAQPIVVEQQQTEEPLRWNDAQDITSGKISDAKEEKRDGDG